MKKYIIYLLVIGLFFISTPVNAKTNKISIYEDDNRLYYSNSNNDNIFIDHDNMTPGVEYEDYLKIENNSKKDNELYLQFVDSNNSSISSSLLDYIELKLYLDDELIYYGSARGVNYDTNGINLDDVVKIKTIKSGDVSKLKVVSKLADEYSLDKGLDSSDLEWHFYTIMNDEVVEIENGVKTKDNIKSYVVVFIAALSSIVFVTVNNKRKRESN